MHNASGLNYFMLETEWHSTAPPVLPLRVC
jgi:hypothetical protein